jgi:hypothetical protein
VSFESSGISKYEHSIAVRDEAKEIDESVEGFTSIYGRADLNANGRADF